MTFTPYQHDQWITGTRQITNTAGVIAQGQTLAARTPLGQHRETGEFHAWNPGANDGTEVAVRLTPFAVDTQTGSQRKQLIDGGVFNPALVHWPEAVSDAQKATAFMGTPIALQLPGQPLS